MISFKYINRSKEKDIVLLPGWATDGRIFENLDLDFNYLIPEDFEPSSIEAELLALPQKISILGWSMGAFAAADFASKHQDLVDQVILVGVKEKYDRGSIAKVKEYLKENKKAYLYKFYHECFSSSEREIFGWFKKSLMKDYIEKFDLDFLSGGLDYLLDSPLNILALKNDKIRLVWGIEDKIVPAAEVAKLKDALPQKEFIFVENSGHLPFLNKGFKALL